MTVSELKNLRSGDRITYRSVIFPKHQYHGIFTQDFRDGIYMRIDTATADISISFDELSRVEREG